MKDPEPATCMLTANTNLVTSWNPFMFVSNILNQILIALDETHQKKDEPSIIWYMYSDNCVKSYYTITFSWIVFILKCSINYLIFLFTILYYKGVHWKTLLIIFQQVNLHSCVQTLKRCTYKIIINVFRQLIIINNYQTIVRIAEHFPSSCIRYLSGSTNISDSIQTTFNF